LNDLQKHCPSAEVVDSCFSAKEGIRAIRLDIPTPYATTPITKPPDVSTIAAVACFFDLTLYLSPLAESTAGKVSRAMLAEPAVDDRTNASKINGISFFILFVYGGSIS
jgi:hypothetical protein